MKQPRVYLVTLFCVALLACVSRTRAFLPLKATPKPLPLGSVSDRNAIGVNKGSNRQSDRSTYAIRPHSSWSAAAATPASASPTALFTAASSSDNNIDEGGNNPKYVELVKDGRREKKPLAQTLKKFFKENWLVLGEILVIYLASKNPSFGATGGPLKPEFTISKLGVFTIFFINGIALSITGTPEELQSATKTNMLIQGYNFGFIPLLAKLLVPFYPIPAFRDGLLVLSVLPCTINICVAQTLSAGGNMATAIFNAICANVLGVVITPMLAVVMLGAGKGVSLLSTLRKLGGVVIAPLVLGQICRRTPLGKVAQSLNAYSRTLSSFLLLAIVYNIFSDTFLSGIGVGGAALATLIVTAPIVYVTLTVAFWYLSKWLLPGLDSQTRAAALFCSAQKTLAFGIPFIKTAMGSRPDIAYVLAPLLMYAPTQLLLGSIIFVPAMKRLIERDTSYGDPKLLGGGL